MSDEVINFEKKKKKSKKTTSTEDSVDQTADKVDNLNLDDNNNEVGEFEFKKKKKKSKKDATSSFDQELEKAGIEKKDELASTEAAATGQSKYSTVNEDGEPDITFPELLSRFFDVLKENNPELAAGSGAKYKIPPPSVAREGNKKTAFANVKEISSRMNRPVDHVIQFLFAELGTSGSVDGTNRLIIKGRFQQKQLETVLRRYIMEYVTCKTCKSANTTLSKENRLFFLQCNSCGSRRSVSSIKTGYQAIMRRRDLKKKV